MEIESLEALDDHLAGAGSLRGLLLQDLDLTGYAQRLLDHGDLAGLVVLGGIVPPDVAEVLLHGGAVVFPGLADAPIDAWRGLYHPEDLYAGLEHGYAATRDARTYAWFIDARLRTDAYSTLVRAIHDESVTDALEEFVEARSCIGIMGGHALQRGTAGYASAAALAHRLAGEGHLVLTGGGPGAMEAANLGALCTDERQLSAALEELAAAPGFRPDTTRWARTAMDVRHRILGVAPDLPTDTLGPSARSLGIPTWFYGHEPPNVFCDAIAKYFSNALREDGLLARSGSGIVVLAGAAGTVQEIFQALTPLYYALPEEPLTPLVLVGREHWTERIPIWPALQSLVSGRRAQDSLHLVDTFDEVDELVSAPR